MRHSPFPDIHLSPLSQTIRYTPYSHATHFADRNARNMASIRCHPPAPPLAICGDWRWNNCCPHAAAIAHYARAMAASAQLAAPGACRKHPMQGGGGRSCSQCSLYASIGRSPMAGPGILHIGGRWCRRHWQANSAAGISRHMLSRVPIAATHLSLYNWGSTRRGKQTPPSPPS